MLSMSQVGGVALALAMTLGSAVRADEAVDRCWQVKMGMSSEEVGRLLGTHLPARTGWFVGPGDCPCAFRINNFGVHEIQIGERRAAPPHEAMFAEELRRGIKAWGPPDWIDFSENRLKWYAIWGDSDRDEKTLLIEPESTKEQFISKNGSFLSYMLQKWPIK